jgi:hypothetical protein
MLICTMTLQSVCKIFLSKTLTFEWKFLFNTTYIFEKIIPFQVIQTFFQYFEMCEFDWNTILIPLN